MSRKFSTFGTMIFKYVYFCMGFKVTFILIDTQSRLSSVSSDKQAGTEALASLAKAILNELKALIPFLNQFIHHTYICDTFTCI